MGKENWPCRTCSIHQEFLYNEYFSFLGACDGCFYYEHGCTEDEFYCDEEDTKEKDYDCLTCSYHQCVNFGAMLNCIY